MCLPIFGGAKAARSAQTCILVATLEYAYACSVRQRLATCKNSFLHSSFIVSGILRFGGVVKAAGNFFA